MLVSLLATAHAFCGTFVWRDGALLADTESRVVIANDGAVTTLKLAMDYRGDVDEWSVPREVAYACDDVMSVSRHYEGCGVVLGCSPPARQLPRG